MKRFILIAAHSFLVTANLAAYLGFIPEAGIFFSIGCLLYLVAIPSA